MFAFSKRIRAVLFSNSWFLCYMHIFKKCVKILDNMIYKDFLSPFHRYFMTELTFHLHPIIVLSLSTHTIAPIPCKDTHIWSWSCAAYEYLVNWNNNLFKVIQRLRNCRFDDWTFGMEDPPPLNSFQNFVITLASFVTETGQIFFAPWSPIQHRSGVCNLGNYIVGLVYIIFQLYRGSLHILREYFKSDPQNWNSWTLSAFAKLHYIHSLPVMEKGICHKLVGQSE